MDKYSQTDILHLSASLSRQAGGIYESILGFGLGLNALELSVAALGLEDSDCRFNLERWESVKPHFVNPIGPRSFGYSSQFKTGLMALSPKIIHQHGLWMYISAANLSWSQRNSTPRLISPHGMLEPWALRNSRFKKTVASILYEKKNILSAACLHALNEKEAEDIRQFGYKGPIAIIPNGAPVSVNSDRSNHSTGLNHKKTDRRTLLFLGRLHPKKGLQETISAFAILKQFPTFKNDPWRFIIAGGGAFDYEEDLKNQVAKLGLQEDIEFTGAVYGEEKSKLFSRADAFILPSFSEGLPIAVLEAWTYGLPSFISKHCNLNTAIKKNAAIEIPTEPHAMAQSLSKSFQLGSLEMSEIGERAKKFVNAQYSWNSSCLKMKSVFDWLTTNTAKPDCIV